MVVVCVVSVCALVCGVSGVCVSCWLCCVCVFVVYCHVGLFGLCVFMCVLVWVLLTLLFVGWVRCVLGAGVCVCANS